MKRIILFAKDIQVITGKSERSVRRMIKRLRTELNKPPDRMISVEEFCTFYGLSKEEVEKRLL